MNPMPEIIPMLKQLRLSGILDSCESACNNDPPLGQIGIQN
jgi:hypothetical protein